MSRINEVEFRGRFDRLRVDSTREELDCSVVTSLDNIYHLTGAGFEPSERPFLLVVPPAGARDVAISIETGIDIDGEHPGGDRHSDNVLVTREGYEVLTRLPTEIGALALRG